MIHFKFKNKRIDYDLWTQYLAQLFSGLKSLQQSHE